MVEVGGVDKKHYYLLYFKRFLQYVDVSTLMRVAISVKALTHSTHAGFAGTHRRNTMTQQNDAPVGEPAVGAALVKAVLGVGNAQGAALLTKPRLRPVMDEDGKLNKAATAANFVAKPDMSLLELDEGALAAETAAITAAVTERRQFSAKAVDVISVLSAQIEALQGIEGWADDAEAVEKIASINTRIAKIREQGGQHLENGELFARIENAASLDDAVDVMDTMCTLEAYPGGPGRYRLITSAEWHKVKSRTKGKHPMGTVILNVGLNPLVFLAFEPDDGGEKTPSQKRFESLCQQMVKRVEGLVSEKGASKAETIRADEECKLFDVSLIARRAEPELGEYYLEIPAQYQNSDPHHRRRPVKEGGVVKFEVREVGPEGKRHQVYTFKDGTGPCNALVGSDGRPRIYSGRTRDGGRIKVGLSLTIAQILQKGYDQETGKGFRPPEVYADDTGRDAIERFREIMRRAVFPVLNAMRDAENVVADGASQVSAASAEPEVVAPEGTEVPEEVAASAPTASDAVVQVTDGASGDVPVGVVQETAVASIEQ